MEYFSLENPKISSSSFYEELKKVEKAVEELAKEEFEEQAKQIAKNNKQINVVIDGSWANRRNATAGSVTVLDFETRKIIYQSILEKPRYNYATMEFIKQSDYRGTSQSMESAGFLNWIEFSKKMKIHHLIKAITSDKDGKLKNTLWKIILLEFFYIIMIKVIFPKT